MRERFGIETLMRFVDSVIKKYRAITEELGRINGLLYVINCLTEKLRGQRFIYRYMLVAQPVRQQPLLAFHRGRSVVVRQVFPRETTLCRLPVTADTLERRFKQGGICLGAFSKGVLIGCIWLCFAPYDEDEVRCRFIPMPEGKAAWDFDVYLDPEYRSSYALARMWDEANAYLRQRNVEWSFSRISAFNPGSLHAHQRLGAEHLGTATYIRLGDWQLTVTTLPPFFHFSTGGSSVPYVRLQAPKQCL